MIMLKKTSKHIVRHRDAFVSAMLPKIQSIPDVSVDPSNDFPNGDNFQCQVNEKDRWRLLKSGIYS